MQYLLVWVTFAFSQLYLIRGASICIQKDAISVKPEDPFYAAKPDIDGGKTFYDGKITSYSGRIEEVTSPIIDITTGKRTVIGKMAQMTKDDVPAVLGGAKRAWNGGQGTWPQMSAEERVTAIENVIFALQNKRDEIVKTLMWEICKTIDDAEAEFDRTITFMQTTIRLFREMDTNEGSWSTIQGIYSKVRRIAIGIVLCLGPFNYPFNETYATLIPALLMGNIIIMKIPTIGGLAHMLTMEIYAAHLPAGTIQFLTGSGRELLGPIMKTGDIDCLAFIGGSKAADQVIASHPHPHRLKVFLQLEGKNLGIVFPDANLETAVEQIAIGSLTYNGQRCTAIKLILVHASIIDQFLPKFLLKTQQLGYGLPWEKGTAITPLPEPKKMSYLMGLIEDAVKKGARVLGNSGSSLEADSSGDSDGTCEVYGSNLLRPTILYPVQKEMRIWQEEQFGPVVPIAVYNTSEEILSILRETSYGQQAAIFTAAETQETTKEAAHLLDALATAVGRININTQCGRSPDTLPFSGRRSSAMGTMSVIEALRTFSIETLIAGKYSEKNEAIVQAIAKESIFLAPLKGQETSSKESTVGEL